MRRPVLVLTTAAAVAATALAGPAGAMAATPPVPTGTVVVHLLEPDGGRLALADADVLVSCGFHPSVPGTTDATGTATVRAVPSTDPCYVHVTPRPGLGYDQRVEAGVDGVAVPTGGTAETGIRLRIGATIAGTLIGPGPGSASAPQAGLRVEVYGQRTGTSRTTSSDSRGRYYVNGLPTDSYVFIVTPASGGAATIWDVDAVAQEGADPARHVFEPEHYVHSTYDLVFVLGGSDPDSPPVFRWTGATVKVTNAATGVATERNAGSTSDNRKRTQFVVPSGTYRIEITTPGSAAAPEQHYWYAGEGTPLATTAAGAAPVAVRYADVLTLFAAAPARP